MAANRIGIDLGGTKIHAVCIDSHNRIIRQVLVPTPRQKDEAISEIVSIANGICDKTTKSIGIGVPGPVDFARQSVRTLPNLVGWKDVPLSKIIARL